MTDIIERLRAWRSPLECHHGAVYALASEAADEIERLRAARKADSVRILKMSDEYEAATDEIERLLGRLDKIAKHPDASKLIRQYAAGDL